MGVFSVRGGSEAKINQCSPRCSKGPIQPPLKAMERLLLTSVEMDEALNVSAYTGPGQHTCYVLHVIIRVCCDVRDTYYDKLKK